MSTDNTSKLLRETNNAKANIDQLKRMKNVYSSNKKHNKGTAKMTISVTGYNDCYATCVDEDLFLKLVEDAIASEEKLNEKKFKMVEAIEMIATNEIGVS